MSNPAALPLDKLAKLLPRLGSDHIGEVIATAAAIRRALASVGADLNDFAELVRSIRPLPLPSPPRPTGAPAEPYRPKFKRWAKHNSGEKVMACDALLSLRDASEWERMFVRDITALIRSDPYYPLTTRQIAVIDKLLARVWQQDFGEAAA